MAGPVTVGGESVLVNGLVFKTSEGRLTPSLVGSIPTRSRQASFGADLRLRSPNTYQRVLPRMVERWAFPRP